MSALPAPQPGKTTAEQYGFVRVGTSVHPLTYRRELQNDHYLLVTTDALFPYDVKALCEFGLYQKLDGREYRMFADRARGLTAAFVLAKNLEEMVSK